MAGYLHRTLSKITNSGQKNSTSKHEQNPSASGTASPPPADNCDSDRSPLRVFVEAKAEINGIYREIECYIEDTLQYINELPLASIGAQAVATAEREQFAHYAAKACAIRAILARDHMKVAFFGRTSNGKSSVINAMLRERILPSGMGHTTNCFCQLEGCSDACEAYMMIDDCDEQVSISNLRQLTNALSQDKLSESSLVRICWPRATCALLRDDVVLVDSPGVDVSANLDDWIDRHCLNADVFVLVLNAESTMTRAEKQFFYTVSQKLSEPNVFILNNRWDAAAAHEPETEASVRRQHTERCVHFLTQELKVCDAQEAAARVFFVSARETLQARLELLKGNAAECGAIAPGFTQRYAEFEQFEREFAACISQSALKTKFQQHTLRGKSIATGMRGALREIYERMTALKADKVASQTKLNANVHCITSQANDAKSEMETKIRALCKEIEEQVSLACHEQIWRVGQVIMDFELPFCAEQPVIKFYKRALNKYVEKVIDVNLRATLFSALAVRVEQLEHEMLQRMTQLLPHDNQTLQLVARSQPFEFLYSLNCHAICADFQEDLRFQFSWGLTAMMQRFTGKVRIPNRMLPSIIRVPTAPNLIVAPLKPINGTCVPVQPAQTVDESVTCLTPDQLYAIARLALTTFGAEGSFGGLLVAGFLLKIIGWRVLMSVAGLFSGIYLYERLMWTNAAKERAFKTQYTRHAIRKLKSLVDLNATSCSQQVQQTLQKTLVKLTANMQSVTSDMNEQLKSIDDELGQLGAVQTQLQLLHQKSKVLHNDLECFEDKFIH